MSKNFSFNINTSFNTNSKKTSKKGMTPQEEYWLNRFLRDYSHKIFILFILFFIFLFGVIYFASQNNSASVTTGNNINIIFDN